MASCSNRHIEGKASQTSQKTNMRDMTWHDRIKNFTPSWFAACMGTGVVCSLLQNFPYAVNSSPPTTSRRALTILAACFLLLNAVLFLFFSTLTLLRYLLFRRLWNLMIRHPIQSLFLGCFPMALATLISGSVVVLCKSQGEGGFGIGGEGLVWTLWIFWWIDVALSALSNFGMFYTMVTHQTHTLLSLSAVWLLPIVPTIVASSTGCIVAEVLQPISPSLALLTYQVAAALVACGVSMSLMIITVYVARLVADGFPKAGLTISVLLPLGPLGQGGYALLLMGEAFSKLTPLAPSLPSSPTNILFTPNFGLMLNTVCFSFAFILWVFGLWIMIPGVVVLVQRARNVPFAIPWWGMVFPTGVYALLTIRLASTLASPFLKVLATIYTCVVFVLWTGIAFRTVTFLLLSSAGGRRDAGGSPSLFHAPCLDDAEAGARVTVRKFVEKAVNKPCEQTEKRGGEPVDGSEEGQPAELCALRNHPSIHSSVYQVEDQDLEQDEIRTTQTRNETSETNSTFPV